MDGPLQKADSLGLHIHLYTNVFAGCMEKTAELLNVKTTSTVLMLVPGLAGRRGSAMTMGPQGCLLGGCCESIADRRRWFMKLCGSLELNLCYYGRAFYISSLSRTSGDELD